MVNENRKILAIGAHPDDIEFNAAGYLFLKNREGCDIYFAILTDGSKGTWDRALNPQDLVRTRRDEQLEAGKQIGVKDIVFFDEIDGELFYSEKLVNRIALLIRDLKPKTVISHDPYKHYRLHPDHQAAADLVWRAIVVAREPHYISNTDLLPHRLDELLLFEAESPDYFVNIGDVIEAKLRILLCHKSQYESTMSISKDPTVEEISRFFDWLKDVSLKACPNQDFYCEQFKRLTHL